jgi:methyltransferase (TIGR00027 family)
MDRLFDDPWAASLAGEEGMKWNEHRSDDSVLPIVLRTRFFDEFIERITLQGGIRQVVLMAAGLDTRAYRLTWPDRTKVFELDQPPVHQYKEQILRSAGAQPACVRHTIELDLGDPWRGPLTQSSFDPERPSGWLLEGFLFYLSTEHLFHLLDEVDGLAAPGSWLGFDIINSAVLTSPWTRAWVDMQAASGAPWTGTLEDPKGFLTCRGWNAALSQAGQADAHHGRWTLPVIPTTMPDMPHHWFVTAQKGEPVGRETATGGDHDLG